MTSVAKANKRLHGITLGWCCHAEIYPMAVAWGTELGESSLESEEEKSPRKLGFRRVSPSRGASRQTWCVT